MNQRDPWSSVSRSRFSARWTNAAAGWNRTLTDALIAAAAIGPDHLVLDLAAGSGDPSLEIIQRFPSARVVALDRSFVGLRLAQKKSAKLGVASQITFLQSDVHAIPLASESTDRITCRFGVMFFEEVGTAMNEMLRILKPGGRIALLACGPFEQPLFEATLGTVLRFISNSQLPQSTRAIYRFASHGSLSAELSAVGFREVLEEEVKLPRIWEGPAEQLWKYLQEVSTLYRPLLASVPAKLRARAEREVVAELSRFAARDRITIPVQVILATGTKP